MVSIERQNSEMLIELEADQEFKEVCQQIKEENRREEEWALVESDDIFQTANFVGGFDAIEMEFCFSYYDKERQEYWFQLPLEEVIEIAEGKRGKLRLRVAEN